MALDDECDAQTDITLFVQHLTTPSAKERAKSAVSNPAAYTAHFPVYIDQHSAGQERMMNLPASPVTIYLRDTTV